MCSARWSEREKHLRREKRGGVIPCQSLSYWIYTHQSQLRFLVLYLLLAAYHWPCLFCCGTEHWALTMIRGSGITGQSNNNGNAEHCAKKGGNEYHFYNLRYDRVSGHWAGQSQGWRTQTQATTELIMLFQTIISACFSLIFRIQDPLALNLVPDPQTAYVGEYLLNILGHFCISQSSDADANFTILKQ